MSGKLDARIRTYGNVRKLYRILYRRKAVSVASQLRKAILRPCYYLVGALRQKVQ